MQINPLVIFGATVKPNSVAPASARASSSDPIEDTNNMFMTLLAAQLKNQTPFDPVDPMQFTNELVQFNMLEQLTQINNILQQSGAAAAPNHASPKIEGEK
ncbi:MAG TPA: flagellar hook capping FlgD N-terminal domain-containing protein [Terriglobales bacterium]|jgi:flagellar hook assembly protein FlgD